MGAVSFIIPSNSANIQPTTKPDSTPASYYLIGVTIGAVIGAVIGAAIFGIGSAPGAIIGAGLGGVLGSMFASTFNTPSGPQGPTVDLPQFPIHSQKPNNNDSAEDAILNYNLLNQQQEHYDDMNDYFD